MSVQIVIKGRVGKDLDIKFTPAGLAFVPFSVVTNGRKKVANEWIDVDTSWWECKAFGAIAEAIVDMVHRGDLLTITGTMKQTNWMDKIGNKKTSYEVIVDTVAKQVVVQKYHGQQRARNSDAIPLGANNFDEAGF